MSLKEISTKEMAVLRFFESADALTVEVIRRNVGCECGCAEEALETLDHLNLIEIEDGWVEITGEGRAVLGHDVPTRSAAPVAEE